MVGEEEEERITSRAEQFPVHVGLEVPNFGTNVSPWKMTRWAAVYPYPRKTTVGNSQQQNGAIGEADAGRGQVSTMRSKLDRRLCSAVRAAPRVIGYKDR